MEQKDFEEWIDLTGIEKTRTYHFGGGVTYTVDKPAKLFVKQSGSHKLTDEDGCLHYIRNNWVAFSADGEWKFNVE